MLLAACSCCGLPSAIAGSAGEIQRPTKNQPHVPSLQPAWSPHTTRLGWVVHGPSARWTLRTDAIAFGFGKPVTFACVRHRHVSDKHKTQLITTSTVSIHYRGTYSSTPTTVQKGGATEFRNRHKIVSFFLFDP
jgi:hypothetical protein